MNVLGIVVKGDQRVHGTQRARCLRVVPPPVKLVAIGIQRRVEGGCLEIVTKDMSYSTGADLVYVFAARIARIFGNLEKVSAHSQSHGNIAYNVDELVNEVGVSFKPVDSSAKPGYQALKLYKSLDVPET
jgi:hypothetical protein